MLLPVNRYFCQHAIIRLCYLNQSGAFIVCVLIILHFIREIYILGINESNLWLNIESDPIIYECDYLYKCLIYHVGATVPDVRDIGMYRNKKKRFHIVMGYTIHFTKYFLIPLNLDKLMSTRIFQKNR